MKAFFDRTEPYYLSRVPTFDGNEVEIDGWVLDLLDKRKKSLVLMEEAIENAPAPEDSAQNLSDLFTSLLDGEISG